MTITGRPVPKVVWYRNGVQITKKLMDIINIAGSSTLFVRDADRTYSGLYTVEATNSSGCKKENILVQVQGMHIYLIYMSQWFISLHLLLILSLHGKTLLESQLDPSLSATFQRANALCLGIHQRTMGALKYHITSLRSVRPPRFLGRWYLTRVSSALLRQPNS